MFDRINVGDRIKIRNEDYTTVHYLMVFYKDLTLEHLYVFGDNFLESEYYIVDADDTNKYILGIIRCSK